MSRCTCCWTTRTSDLRLVIPAALTSTWSTVPGSALSSAAIAICSTAPVIAPGHSGGDVHLGRVRLELIHSLRPDRSPVMARWTRWPSARGCRSCSGRQGASWRGRGAEAVRPGGAGGGQHADVGRSRAAGGCADGVASRGVVSRASAERRSWEATSGWRACCLWGTGSRSG